MSGEVVELERLMDFAPAEWRQVTLGKVVRVVTDGISAADLAALPKVHHYSLPAFDEGAGPEVGPGDTIKSNKTVVPDDCVLFSKLNPRIPRIWRVRGDAPPHSYCSTEFWPLVAQGSGVDLDYLTHYLSSAAFLGHPDITPSSSTNSHQRVDRKAFERFEFVLPPLDEQRRIAEVLRSVDEAIAASEMALQQSEVALSALSDELFSAAMSGGDSEWPQDPLEDMLDNIIDYRGVPPPKADAGIPLLTAKNVRFGYLDFEPREYIAEKDYDSWMRRGLPSAGDIMFTTEAPLGNVAEFPNIKAALGQRTLTLVPKASVLDAKFLKWLLLSKPAQDLIWSHATGSTAKGIKQRTFRKLKFGFPALDEQVRISELLEDIGAARDAAKRSNEAYATMKTHLLSDLLSGRVRVPA